MSRIKAIIAAALVALSFNATAQFSQLGASNQFMLKAEIGYAPFMGNYGKLGNEGYNLSHYQNAAGLNVMAGINISQDFFLGAGVGYTFCAPMRPARFDKSSHMAVAFIDMDFRPVGDTWAPMVGARVGGSFLMNPNNYGNTISPYLEVYAGLNWFYDHALQQMDKNYHSLFAEVGVVMVQQTVFIPIRVGWRW